LIENSGNRVRDEHRHEAHAIAEVRRRPIVAVSPIVRSDGGDVNSVWNDDVPSSIWREEAFTKCKLQADGYRRCKRQPQAHSHLYPRERASALSRRMISWVRTAGSIEPLHGPCSDARGMAGGVVSLIVQTMKRTARLLAQRNWCSAKQRSRPQTTCSTQSMLSEAIDNCQGAPRCAWRLHCCTMQSA
jgi:hypothetical protein